MEQEVGVRGGEDRDMNRKKSQQVGGGQVHPQQSQPQNCPRCNSLNTKFCYYNNYSLLQPRYFCKTCKRHWTQGGTLRNVPVGGSSSKGKRAKNSSSSQLQQPQPPLPPPTEEVVQTQQPNLTTMVNTTDPSPMVAPSIIDQGGGEYLSSIPTTHSKSLTFDHSLKVRGGVVGSSSDFSLVSGIHVASLSSQYQIQPSQFYQMGGRERELHSLSTSQQGLIIPSSMDNINSCDTSYNDWLQSFINNANNKTSDASLWSTIDNNTTSLSVNTERNTNVVGSSPWIPNQKPYFPGRDPSPSSN